MGIPKTRWLVVISLVGIALIGLMWGHESIIDLYSRLNAALTELNGMRDTIRSYGLLAPVVFIGLQILQVLVAPLPGEASGILGGYLFGAWIGFLYSTIGLTIGSGIAFAIGHFFRNLVLSRLAGRRLYRQFNHLICKGDFVVPFILFLIPGFPKDILAYFMGLSVMSARVFIFITTVARMPGTLMLSMQGAQVYEQRYLGFLLLLAISIAVSVPSYYFRKPILAKLERLNNHPSNHRGKRRS